MSGSSEGLISQINYYLYDLSDERTRDLWPNFATLASILSAYIFFVKKAGPEWMKDKKPYDLKNTILIYNVVQIVTCFYAFFEGLRLYVTHHNLICQPVDYSNGPGIKKMHGLVSLYVVLKISDLLDTVFFVLRKKDRQISTLHVYHHTLMPFASWFAYKYFPNGHGVFLGIINCLVHCVMYTYYLIAGLGPEYQKYLWWKKYVTTLQLTQFVIIFFHNLFPLFNGGCGFPKSLHIALCICSAHFIYMFGSFYYVTYIKKTPDQKTFKKNPKTQTKLHSK